MAIDYQQILMDMNRPRRRQGRSGRKLLVAGVLCLALGGGTFALWRSGFAADAWAGGAGVAVNLWRLAFPAPRGADETALDVVTAVETRPAQSAGSAPAPSGPISIAAEAGLRPESASLRPPPSGASGPSATPAVMTAPASAGAEATPVLSDARAQLRIIDQMLRDNPAEAMARVERLIGSGLADVEAAEAGYRLGYAARMLRDEDKAEKSWRDTADRWPTLRGGRYSALALADTWFHRHATARPQISYWDDMQLLYSRVLGMDDAPFLPEEVKARVKANLGVVNASIMFGSGPTRLARYHKVESGELLGGIAGKYRVDYESIARVNGINPNRIRVGMDLKIIVGEVEIVVRKNAGDPSKTPTLTWFLDGRWMREYQTCVGDADKTPAGTYTLVSKERDPSWTNPLNGQLLPNSHPDNILGSRWMAMKGMNTQGLGIHGTTVDDSIPGYTSAGCIRLLNRDVEELFSYARIGAKVTVMD